MNIRLFVLLVLLSLASFACKQPASTSEKVPSPTTQAQQETTHMTSTQDTNPPETQASTPDTLPEGWPWAMLRLEGRTIQKMEKPKLDAALHTAHGVLEFHAFVSEAPIVHLYVYRFENQSQALAAADPIMAWSKTNDRPWYPDSVINGAYLLIAGMEGEKPPSPEMETARDAYIQSFAGEE